MFRKKHSIQDVVQWFPLNKQHKIKAKDNRDIHIMLFISNCIMLNGVTKYTIFDNYLRKQMREWNIDGACVQRYIQNR